MSIRGQSENSGLECVYGVNPVTELMRSGKRRTHCLWIDEKLFKQSRMSSVLKLAATRNVRVAPVSKHDLSTRSRSREHQGLVAETDPYPYAKLDDRIYAQPRLLLLDNVEDPRNTGAILRSALIFGFSHVLLPLRGVPEIYASVVKTSAGASEWLNIVRGANANKYVQQAIDRGFRVISMDMNGDTALNDVSPEDERPLLLVIGGEDKRIGQYILKNSDTVVHIPQHGEVNSLNASVAAGIALYHFAGGAPTT